MESLKQEDGMYEVVFDADERSRRSPLHRELADATAYADETGLVGEWYEVWQVADDLTRTRTFKRDGHNPEILWSWIELVMKRVWQPV